MTQVPKPSENPQNWAQPADSRVRPPDNLAMQGFQGGNSLPFQYYNYKNHLYSNWINYLECTTDELNRKAFQAFTVSSTDTSADHTTIQAAIDAASVGDTILVQSSFALDTAININKDDLTLIFGPGVSLSKGTASDGLVISSSRNTIRGLRIAGFVQPTDTAVHITNTASLTRIYESIFSENNQDVRDQGSQTSLNVANFFSHNDLEIPSAAQTNTIIQGLGSLDNGDLVLRFQYYLIRSVTDSTPELVRRAQAGEIIVSRIFPNATELEGRIVVNHTSILEQSPSDFNAGVTFGFDTTSSRLTYSAPVFTTGTNYTSFFNVKLLEKIRS